jgi:signal recognition particle subunit SRP54
VFGYLAEKMSDLFESFGKKTTIAAPEIERALNSVQETLLNADVPYKIVRQVSDSMREKLQSVSKKSNVIFQERLQALLFGSLVDLMGGEEKNKELESLSFPRGSIILVAGLQGAGKTTTIAKLATFIKNENKQLRISTTSLDFVRPAAIEQLRILAERSGIDFLTPEKDNVSATLVKVKQELATDKYDIFFIDTPGRLHINNELMQELRNITVEINPTHTLLVIDSMTGQESLNVARAFDEVLNITGAVLTKSDSDSKGGVALSLFSEIKKPVVFLGCGEKLQDLERFVPKRIASRMLGGGDTVTLCEKIEREMSKEAKGKTEAFSAKFLRGEFNLQDFLEQMELVQSLGPLQKVMSYIPGFTKISPEQLGQAEKITKNLRSIILSMTTKERMHPGLLNNLRLKRIAQGSGVPEQDIKLLLNKFEESKQFAKLIGKRKW